MYGRNAREVRAGARSIENNLSNHRSGVGRHGCELCLTMAPASQQASLKVSRGIAVAPNSLFAEREREF